MQANQTAPRVGVDGFNMAMPRGTGVATYGRMLTQVLGQLGHPVDVLYGMLMGPKTPAMLREIIFFDSLDQERSRRSPTPMTPRWFNEIATAPLGRRALEVPVTGRVIASPFASRLPHFDRIMNVFELFALAQRHFSRTQRFLTVHMPDPPAIMHWTYPLPIRVAGARNVYTLHDLVPLRLPYTTLDNKRAYLRLIRGCLRWGDHICTVSLSSQRDITSLFPVDGSRVTNTYQTAFLPADLAPGNELPGWLDGVFGLQHQGYLLFYGALEPKKNIGRMVEGYLASGVETPLVIVGGRAWKSENELRLVLGTDGKATTVGKRVKMLEYVPASWLGALVRGARAVLFPSLYEGFGLPVLEAMQLGTPVLTSTESSLPEVAGAAAMQVNPYDVAAISSAIRKLDEDAELRRDLAGAGYAQARHFSPEAYAERVRAMYRTILDAPAGQVLDAARDLKR